MAWRLHPSWRPLTLLAGVVASLIAAGLILILTHAFSSDPKERTFVGGCPRFDLYAQNQFDAYGTLIWTAPSPTADNYPGLSANQIVVVDGWVKTRTPYPGNQTPFDSPVWYHLANGAGWVTFAGVRAVPTSPGPLGDHEPGSDPAPVDSSCAGVYRG